jgi:hypothetical protein
LTDHDLTTLGDQPLGYLCEVARNRSGLTLREVATAAGVSHVTVLAWERRSDLRMVEFWKKQGFIFLEGGVENHVAQLGKLRTFSVGGRITDRGVKAEWSGMILKRVVDPTIDHKLEEHEYAVDEATGTYRFSQLLHGRRSVIVSFTRIAG